MISTSKEFDNKIRADTRTFYARICVDGIPLDVGIKSITVYKGSCGTEFTIGAVFAPYAEITSDAPLQNLEQLSTLTVEIGLEAATDSNGNGVVEYVQVARYSNVAVKNTSSSCSIVATGYLANALMNQYSPLVAFPTTIQAILNDISAQTGISITVNNMDTSGVIEKEITNYTYRETLGYLAGCMGGYVTEDATGHVALSAYNTEPTLSTDAGEYNQMPEFDATAYTVTGLTVEVIDADAEIEDGTSVASYASGTDINRIVVQNPLMTQALFDSIKNKVIGLTWHSGVANLSHGDMRLEHDDVLSVADVNGDTFTLPCMNLTINYDGGVWCDVSAPGKPESELSNGPLADAVAKNYLEFLKVREFVAKKITADRIDVKTLEAIAAKIAGFVVGDTYIANNTESLCTDEDSVYLGTDGISCGTAFSVTKTGALRALNAVISGRIKADSGEIGGWKINTDHLYKTGDANYTDKDGNEQSSYINSYLDARTLRLVQRLDDSQKFVTSELTPGLLYLYNDETKSEFELNAIEEILFLHGFKVCLDSQGLFMWNPGTWVDADSAINVLNISSNKNLVIGYGKYAKEEGSTNIYGGTGIQFAVKNPAATWKPYYAAKDSVSISWHGTGYITSNKMAIHFSVPLSKPVVGATKVNISNNDGLTIRQNGKYLYGSSADAATTNATYTANIDTGGNSVHIVAKMNDLDAINNDVCGIFASLILIFS